MTYVRSVLALFLLAAMCGALAGIACRVFQLVMEF
jgi:hypothetical protein